MNNIINRLAVMAAVARDEGLGVVWLKLHPRPDNPAGFDWQASIIGEGSDVPLLDSHGEASLAACGASPLDALRALDTELWRLP